VRRIVGMARIRRRLWLGEEESEVMCCEAS
jgi:hypothetical protein